MKMKKHKRGCPKGFRLFGSNQKKELKKKKRKKEKKKRKEYQFGTSFGSK